MNLEEELNNAIQEEKSVEEVRSIFQQYEIEYYNKINHSCEEIATAVEIFQRYFDYINKVKEVKYKWEKN